MDGCRFPLLLQMLQPPYPSGLEFVSVEAVRNDGGAGNRRLVLAFLFLFLILFLFHSIPKGYDYPIARVLIAIGKGFKLMLFDGFEDRFMSRTRNRELAVLERDELRNEEFPVAQCLQPVSKFGQVLFIYRLPDVEANGFKVKFDKPYARAVVCDVKP